jgi:hypothetical protein
MEADERAFNAITAPASRSVGTANINIESLHLKNYGAFKSSTVSQ